MINVLWANIRDSGTKNTESQKEDLDSDKTQKLQDSLKLINEKKNAKK